MKPAETTRSGSNPATVSAMARSQWSRLVNWPTFFTNVGIPARSARARASMSSRSAPTATIRAPYAGSAVASIRAWRLVPEPDTSTTRRAGLGVGTRRSLDPGSPGRAALPPGHDQPTHEAAQAERGDRVDEDVEADRTDLLHPPGPHGATRDSGDQPEQHAGGHAAGAAPQGALVPPQRRQSPLGASRGVGRDQRGDRHHPDRP